MKREGKCRTERRGDREVPGGLGYDLSLYSVGVFSTCRTDNTFLEDMEGGTVKMR